MHAWGQRLHTFLVVEASKSRTKSLAYSPFNSYNPATPVENVALFKSTNQSSTFSGQFWWYTSWGPENAVDGNINGGLYGWGLPWQHTATESHPWWTVDFEGTYGVSTVEFWVRPDCCSDHFTDFCIRFFSFTTSFYLHTYFHLFRYLFVSWERSGLQLLYPS